MSIDVHSAAERAADVIEMVGDRAEADVVVGGGTHGLTRFANSFIHQNVAEEGLTISLRVAVDGRVTSSSTTRVGHDDLSKFVDDTIAAAALQPVDEAWPGLTPPRAAAVVSHADEATAFADPSERAARVKAFVDAGAGMLAAGYCETLGAITAYANTQGQHLAGAASRATLDGIHRTKSSAGSGHHTSRSIEGWDGSAVGRLAAARARDGMGATDLKPGDYEVVLAPECAASMVVFLSFYGFNAKQVLEGQSFVKEGTRQFDEQITLRDDAYDERSLGVPFDRDGTPKERLRLVDRGMTSAIAYDRRTAHRLGAASTGHAVAGGEVYGAFPTNLFLENGDVPVDDLIGSVELGLYVATFNYCRILDPKTQVVTGLTRNGTFMIENGAITHPITNLRFTQSFVAALGPGAVLGVGDDARFADSEFGPGIVHAPTLRLASWHFTGGAEG